MKRIDDKELAHMRRLIESEVGWFNGWQASQPQFQESCEKAASKVLAYLHHREQRLAKSSPKSIKACHPEEWGPSDARRLTCSCGNPDPFHME